MNDLMFFLAHNHGNTWTRASVPAGVTTASDLVRYLQRGGRVVSPWLDLPDRVRFVAPRAIGQTVVAQFAEKGEV